MLDQKNAVVTGSTSGIGLGIATALAAEGCGIMLNGFGDRGTIDRLRRDIAEKHGVRVAYSAADMTKPPEIQRMIADAGTELGSCDILVNNAGIQHVAPIDRFPEERWDAIIAVNLSAAFHATKAVLPAMRGRRWGRIVNIASAHGLVASVEKVAYVAAKHGIVGLTKVTALECANDGITCNAICPGWVLTPLAEKQVAARAAETGQSAEDAKRALVREKQPMASFTTPQQLGALVVFLCSPAASTMTGTSLPVDGGWVAH
jgi:3-hydroxybutyrate dehydrogenase